MASVDGTITLRDGYNNPIVVRTRQFDSGALAFYHVFDDRLPAGTNKGGTITTGGTSQLVAAANTDRVGLTFQNISDTNMYLSENGAAASPTNGYLIAPNIVAEIGTNMAVYVYCATTGKAFTATEIIRP